jgi:hypothetical protein
MPFVKRDEQGRVIAVSLAPEPGCDEEMAWDSAALAAFRLPAIPASTLDASDQGLVRVLEDLVELLVDKGVILFTELPDSAQQKIMHRHALRSELSAKLDLIGDD